MTTNPKCKVPQQPDWLSQSDCDEILMRNDPPVCENWADGTCPLLNGATNDDGEILLNYHHVQARAKGGDNSARNIRLICAHGCNFANCEQGITTDPRWKADFWFDRAHSFEGLRKAQLLCGHQNVFTHAELFLDRDKRNELLKYCSLFALTTGAGKTMLTVSTLLSINQLILTNLGNEPRIGRALWFVKDRTSVDQLAAELEKEVVLYGLHREKPSVLKCEASSDLSKGYHDFTVSCPQAFWDRTNQSRDDTQIKKILKRFDVIIFDEADWAKDQVVRLIKLSSHSLKFALTATPIDRAGEVLRHFAIARVASYETVFGLDQCLKIVPRWDGDADDNPYIVRIPHDGYVNGVRGERYPVNNGVHADKTSEPGAAAAIMQAIIDSDRLEAEMKDRMPSDWYSPHILVRTGSIKEAHSIAQRVEELLYHMYRNNELQCEGWRTALMHSGVRHRYSFEGGALRKLDIPDVEKTLIAPLEIEALNGKAKKSKNRLPSVHPWMLAKEQNAGRSADQSARILIVVDIGIRGLNNWTCLSVVDISQSESVPEQVQLDGRTHRLPNHLKPYLSKGEYERFLTSRYYFPDACAKGQTMMREARRWIFAMDTELKKYGLPSWDNLSGEPVETPDPEKPKKQTFTEADRLQIDLVLGGMIESGSTLEDIAQMSDDEKDVIINILPPEITEERRAKAKEHINKVATDAEYRNGFSRAPQNNNPVTAVLAEYPKPPSEYTDPELRRFIRESPVIEQPMKAVYLADLEKTNGQLARHAIGKMLYQERKRLYAPLVKIRTLQTTKSGTTKGIVNEIAYDLWLERKKRQIELELGITIKAVNAALKWVFDVPSVENDGPLDHPGYHHKICTYPTSGKIEKMTDVYLTQWGYLGPISLLYGGSKAQP